MAQRAVATPAKTATVDHRSSTLVVLLTRLATPLWFIILALIQIRRGEASLPYWLQALSGKMSVSPGLVLRLLIGVQLAGACIMLVHGRWARRTAIALLMAACFTAIAEISAIGFKVEIILTAMVLGVSALLLAGVGLGEPEDLPASSGLPRAVAAAAGVVAAGVIAALLPLKVSDALPGQSTPEGAGPASVASVAAAPIVIPGERTREPAPQDLPNEFLINNDLYEGGSAIDAELHRFLPDDLAATLREGTHFIVLYNLGAPSHRLFDEMLLGIDRHSVIAIRVPRAPRVGPDVDAGMGPVSCAGCDLVALPRGPLWFCDVPSIIRVDGGKVTCLVSGMDELAIEGCLHGSP
jgi:hypothetical protein